MVTIQQMVVAFLRLFSTHHQGNASQQGDHWKCPLSTNTPLELQLSTEKYPPPTFSPDSTNVAPPLTFTITQEVDKGESITIPILQMRTVRRDSSVCLWAHHFISPSLVKRPRQDSNWHLPGFCSPGPPLLFSFQPLQH